MKTLFHGLCLVLCATFAVAQKSPSKFGDIPSEDLNMKVYDKDSSAVAVILFDYGEAYLNPKPTTVSLDFKRHVRIKILKKEGLEWADVEVPLHRVGSTEDRITNLKAVTYNLENNQVVETKMNKDGVFKEKFNKYIDLHKFTLSNVREGSVIEYSYTVTSDFFWEFPDWQFQYDVPVRRSEFWALIPEFFIYEKFIQGYVPVTSYDVTHKNYSEFAFDAHHWVADYVPAFKTEPFISSEKNYTSKINFALSHFTFPGRPVQEVMGSWKKLNDLLLESEQFGGIIRSSGYLKKQVGELTEGITDPLKKLTVIYDYVKQNLEWSGYNEYSGDSPKKVFETKKGSSGEINIILASMLEKADIQVDMVVLSTRDHGFIRKQFPMQNQFNYTICLARIGDKEFLLDATEKHLPMSVLPDRCLNGEGLIISSTRHGWINLSTKAKAKTTVSTEFVVSNTGDLSGKISYLRDGYDAHKMRKSYEEEGEEKYIKNSIGTKGWQIQKSNFKSIKEINELPNETHELSIPEYVSVSGDLMYLNPLVTSRIDENPFRVENREYPVDYGSSIDRMYVCRFTLPEGYVVDELPKSKVFLLPGNAARYIYNCTQVGNVISLVSTFQINKTLFIQSEYPDLREFYNQVIAKQAEQIVLKKK